MIPGCGIPGPVSLSIALALQAAALGEVPAADRASLNVEQLLERLAVAVLCPASEGATDVVVCGRAARRINPRFEPDARFEQERLPDGRFIRRLSDAASIEGGGPRGSAGVTLRLGF